MAAVPRLGGHATRYPSASREAERVGDAAAIAVAAAHPLVARPVSASGSPEGPRRTATLQRGSAGKVERGKALALPGLPVRAREGQIGFLRPTSAAGRRSDSARPGYLGRAVVGRQQPPPSTTTQPVSMRRSQALPSRPSARAPTDRLPPALARRRTPQGPQLTSRDDHRIVHRSASVDWTENSDRRSTTRRPTGRATGASAGRGRRRDRTRRATYTGAPRAPRGGSGRHQSPPESLASRIGRA